MSLLPFRPLAIRTSALLHPLRAEFTPCRQGPATTRVITPRHGAAPSKKSSFWAVCAPSFCSFPASSARYANVTRKAFPGGFHLLTYESRSQNTRILFITNYFRYTLGGCTQALRASHPISHSAQTVSFINLFNFLTR